MKFMTMMFQEETLYITDKTKPKDLHNSLEVLISAWVYEDPDYVPPSSSQIREFVAQCMRDQFYVVSGDNNG